MDRGPTALTYVGHATVLVELAGARLLTDPLLSKGIVHVRRQVPDPPIGDLLPLDAILISHAHRDHLHHRTLSRLGGECPVIVPSRGAAAVRSSGVLGWLHLDREFDGHARDFYVPKLRDWKGSAEVDQMIPNGMAMYGRLCGWTLARTHARSGDRIAIAVYLGGGTSFDRVILKFSNVYAEQNEHDYERLTAAVRTGKLVAKTGLRAVGGSP